MGAERTNIYLELGNKHKRLGSGIGLGVWISTAHVFTQHQRTTYTLTHSYTIYKTLTHSLIHSLTH